MKRRPGEQSQHGRGSRCRRGWLAAISTFLWISRRVTANSANGEREETSLAPLSRGISSDMASLSRSRAQKLAQLTPASSPPLCRLWTQLRSLAFGGNASQRGKKDMKQAGPGRASANGPIRQRAPRSVNLEMMHASRMDRCNTPKATGHTVVSKLSPRRRALLLLSHGRLERRA